MLVFLNHTPLFTDGVTPFMDVLGVLGVDLFLTLSTFLLITLLSKEFNRNQKIDKKKFFIRRVLRIWPIYFIYLFFLVDLPDKHLMAFTSNFYSVWNDYPVGHIWTISYEEQVYFLLPFLVPLFQLCEKKRLKGIFLLAITSLVVIKNISISMGVSHNAIYILPFNHFEPVIMGILLALRVPNTLLDKISSQFLLALVVFLLITISHFDVTDVGYSLNYFYWASSSIAMIMTYLSTRERGGLSVLLSNSSFIYLGKISYGLYLYHMFASAKAMELMGMLSIENAFVVFSGKLLMTVVVATVSWIIIEKPVLKLKDRFQVVRSGE